VSTNLDVPAAPPPTRALQVAADAHGAGAAGRSWLGAALLALGAGVAALSLLGPLMSAVIDYRITDLVLSQLVGLDAVSLALVAPLAALAGVLTLRGHALGPVLALGPATYVAYLERAARKTRRHLPLMALVAATPMAPRPATDRS
jgi:hypothetical protein